MNASLPRPWISLTIGVALAALAGGCDVDASVSACLPEQGCDGIAEIVEVGAPPALATPTPEPGGSEDAPICPATDVDEATYVAEDPEVCAELEVECRDGWVNLDPACGCGCVFEAYEPETAGGLGGGWWFPGPFCAEGPSRNGALTFRLC